MDFYGYIIDDHHACGVFRGDDGLDLWRLITTETPIVNGKIDADAGFHFSVINPTDFEVDGKRYHIQEAVNTARHIVSYKGGS